MPRPSRRSRTLRRIHVKTTKGSKLVYAKRKPSKAPQNVIVRAAVIG